MASQTLSSRISKVFEIWANTGRTPLISFLVSAQADVEVNYSGIQFLGSTVAASEAREKLPLWVLQTFDAEQLKNYSRETPQESLGKMLFN